MSSFKNYLHNKKINLGSLFSRYFCIVFCLTFVPLMILASFMVYYNVSQSKSAQKNALNSSLQYISTALDNSLSNYSTIHQLCVSDSIFMDYLSENEDILTADAQAVNHIIKTIEKNIYSSSSYLDSIIFYSFKNQYVLSNKNSGYIDRFLDDMWYKHFLNPSNDCNMVYSPSSNINYTPNTLSILYPIYDYGQNVGLLVFNMDIDQFIRSFKLTDDVYISVCDFGGSTIYQNYENPLTDNIIRASSKISGSNIYVTLAQPLVPVTNFILTAVFIFGVCILISFFLAYYVASALYKSISKIVSNTYTIISGEMPEPDVYDEILAVNKNLLLLTEQTDNAKIELMRVQAYAMQAQINPHFLFNTLNSMYILAKKIESDDSRLSDITLLLSDILDASLNSSQTIIPIHKELIYTKKYVEILKIRENNSFQFIWNAPVELSQYSIVKLSIQPLIENAMEHGLKNIKDDRDKIIRLRIYEKNDVIYVEVSDNGDKVPEHIIDNINKRINDASPLNRQNIGLKNVNNRIKLAFGDDYGCRLVSDNSGTHSIITLPKTKK